MYTASIPTPYFKPYASIATAIVPATDDPSGRSRHAIGFCVGTGGTAVVRPRGGPSDGSKDETLTPVPGKDYWIEFDRLVSGTATTLLIYWGR